METINSISSCFFTTPKGNLIQAFCPFLVLVQQNILQLQKGQSVLVTSVKTSEKGEIVFEISGKYYYHHYFQLEL